MGLGLIVLDLVIADRRWVKARRTGLEPKDKDAALKRAATKPLAAYQDESAPVEREIFVGVALADYFALF